MTATTTVDNRDKRLLHLTTNEQQALSVLVDRLREKFDEALLRVVLFGSKARGGGDAESDIDVLVVARIAEADYRQRRRDILEATYDLDLDYGVVLSLLVETEPEYIEMRRANMLINRSIEADGITLWTSPQNEPTFA
jgi:predicted nucleotidyltransferase